MAAGAEVSGLTLKNPMHIRDSATAISVLQSASDISHRLFDGIVFTDLSVVQSLLHGVIFRRCNFRHCIFDRSDFEGARFEQCELLNSSFDVVDIRTTSFHRCKIDGSRFDSAHITDNHFEKCNFESTSFAGSTLIGNHFLETNFDMLSNARATILHSLFAKCRLKSIKFADCTILYTIFDTCQFEKFTINADALGLTFGLTRADLKSFNLLFLGANQTWPEGIDSADAIIESFLNRKWSMHFALSKLCYSSAPRLDAWRLIFDVILHQIAVGRGITRDDIQFVTRIAHRLAKAKQLPFAALIFAFDRVQLLPRPSGKLTQASDLLELLARELQALLANAHGTLLSYAEELAKLPARQYVTASFVFAKRPAKSPTDYMRYLAQQLGAAKLVSLTPTKGSWIEPVQMTVQGLTAVLVSLYLLEGCIVALTRLRARATVLISREMPATYLEYAHSPKYQMPPAIEKIVRQTYDGYMSGSLLAPPREADLTTERITEVQVTKPRPPASASPSKKAQRR